MEIIMAILTIFFILGVLLPLLLIYRGWAISILWGWFMVPLGLPPVSIGLAIGIALVAGLLTGSTTKEYETDKERWTAAITALFAPIMTLGLGWLVHTFMR